MTPEMGILRIVPHIWEKWSGEGDAKSAQWSEIGYQGRTGCWQLGLCQRNSQKQFVLQIWTWHRGSSQKAQSEWCPKAGDLAHRLCSQGNMQLSGLSFSVGCTCINAIVQPLTTSTGQELPQDFTPYGKRLQSDKWSPLPHLQCLTLLTPCTVPAPCSTHTSPSARIKFTLNKLSWTSPHLKTFLSQTNIISTRW